MDESSKNDIIRQLESDGNVPEYLKASLVSEIDLIKDTLQVVSLFGGGFFMAAFYAITSIADPKETDR